MSVTKERTIGRDADVRSRVYSDMDNYRRFYSMPEMNDDETVMIQFVAPKLFLFEEYRFVLLKNSIIKPLQPERYYRPDYVSYDEYGTTNLWAMLLFINDIPTIEDFIVESIKIPTEEIIMELARIASSKQALTQIVPLSELPLKDTPSLFSQQRVIPRVIDSTLSSMDDPVDVYFRRDVFTLDIIDVRNRFVDLSDVPIEGSIQLNIVDSPNYLKGKHYGLIKGDNGKNRITWNPRFLDQGIGMMDIMIEGTQFEVLYAKRIRS